MPKNGRRLPDRAAVIDLVKDLRSVIFPGYFLRGHRGPYLSGAVQHLLSE